VNTGGGSTAGGGSSPSGGSGVVIIRYLVEYSNASITGTCTYSQSDGFRIFKFTGSGSITF
jgi:hypothetical protein